jgi:hypothetical protein
MVANSYFCKNGNNVTPLLLKRTFPPLVFHSLHETLRARVIFTMLRSRAWIWNGVIILILNGTVINTLFHPQNVFFVVKTVATMLYPELTSSPSHMNFSHFITTFLISPSTPPPQSHSPSTPDNNVQNAQT